MILQEKFKRAEIYLTSKGETIQEVCEKTGADLVINGHWYNSNGKAIGNFKVDGKVLSQEWGAALGYGWTGDETPVFDWYMEKHDNFLCTIPLLYNGEKLNVSNQALDVRRPCQRPAISFKDGKIIFVYAETATLEQMQDTMLSLGCINALCLDGGGSGKYALKRNDGSYEVEEASTRYIYDYLCIWFEKQEDENDKDEVQEGENLGYLKGIDVSQWQGDIDWQSVKNSDIDFAIIRAGYGQNNIDSKFKKNVTECNKLGIPCGIYWFSYAYTEEMARQEARYVLEAVKPYKINYPVVFDFEGDSVNYALKKGITITKEMASSFAKAFCKELENNHYYAMVYANPDYLNRYYDTDVTKYYDLWLAQWPSNPDFDNPPRKCGIWQYTSSGEVTGISGRVDRNIAYNDYKEIIENAGLNNLDAVIEIPDTPDEDTEGDETTELERAVKWATESGISDGTRLDDFAKRSEIILMLYRENGGK